MKWSLRVATIAGINIRVHVSFLLIVAFGAMQWGSMQDLRGAAFGGLLTLLLFTCVVLHELGHSFAAKAFGLNVREIMLLPIGGVAMLEGRPSRPLHELVIALAGPAVNVVIAALLAVPAGSALLALAAGSGDGMNQLLVPSFTSLLVWLFVANVSLAVFNMIPALPMDGGRVFRALLAMVLDAPRATRIASVVGQVIAVGMGTWAVLQGHLVLSFIAVMVFFAARQERRQEDTRAALTGIDARTVSRRFGAALLPTTRVAEALDILLATQQWELPIMDDGRLVAVVSRDRILAAAYGGHMLLPMRELAEPRIVHVSGDTPVEEVMMVLTRENAAAAGVVDDGQYAGFITPRGIAHAVDLVSARTRMRNTPSAKGPFAGGRQRPNEG